MKLKAIRVMQPVGEFYITSINTNTLLDVTYSRSAEFEGGNISGNQRVIIEKRIREIGEYLNTYNAALPNSIILSANYHENDTLEVDEEKRWRVKHIEGDLFELFIPDERLKICSIIDGQHRINGFRAANIDKGMSLPCSVFIDLPPSLQAHVFSTINFNQQKVDKSLAYQLFGYQLDESDRMKWSPDILAVKLSRVFNEKGPFKEKIKLAKQADSAESAWEISSAVFIEGVLSLISSNPKKDKYIVNKKKIMGYGNRSDLDDNLKLPFRRFYIEGNDKAIQIILEKYFEAISKFLWKGKESDDILFRAVGIAAQFSFLKELILAEEVDLTSGLNFDSKLECLSIVSFSDNEYFSARTATKRRIVNVFKIKLKMINMESLGLDADGKKSMEKALNST